MLKLEGGEVESEWDGSRVRLKIHEVYPEDEGEYSCIIFNDMGKAVTSATLVVESKSLSYLFSHECNYNYVGYLFLAGVCTLKREKKKKMVDCCFHQQNYGFYSHVKVSSYFISPVLFLSFIPLKLFGYMYTFFRVNLHRLHLCISCILGVYFFHKYRTNFSFFLFRIFLSIITTISVSSYSTSFK